MRNEWIPNLNDNSIDIIVESGKYGIQRVLIDADDMLKLNDRRVYVWGTKRHSTLYALVQIEGRRAVRLHRYLLGVTNPKEIIDHINGDGLDNRRRNLRVGTQAGNTKNVKGNKNSSSKFKGVHYSTRAGKWRAQIQVDKRKIWLGTYTTELEAARAYNKAALTQHGEYAKLNEIADPLVAETLKEGK